MPRGRKPIVKKDDFKRANGMGAIKKLSGNRRNPYGVLITSGKSWDKNTMQYKFIRTYIGYYPTREAAQLALNKYVSDPYDIQKSKLTFNDVFELWSKPYYEQLKSSSSIRTVVSAYNHSDALHNRLFAAITITDMRDAIRNANVSPSMQSRMKSLYNLMYEYAVEAEIVQVNVARNFTLKGVQNKIKRTRKEKTDISAEHEALLWKHINYGYVKMILIGIYTGFRPHELCILERENVHLDENYIIGGEKTEAGENRYVPIHPKIKSLVEYYYSESVNKKYLINAFDGQRGTTMTYDKYRGKFANALKVCEIPEGLYTPHCTRHTFITKAKTVKMDRMALKLIVGHELRDVTDEIYDHSDKHKLLQEEILKLE